MIGGIAEAQIEWVCNFLHIVGRENEPDLWHVHHYFATNPDQALKDIERFYDTVGTPLWITEFGSVVSDISATEKFLVWIESRPWIERYAYFPTRMNKLFPWFPQDWDNEMALVEWNRENIKPLGELYRDFQIYNMFIPAIIVADD